MKYKAKQLQTKEWAVFTGKRFFLNTVTTNEQQAKEEAVVMSIEFYHTQMQDAWTELKQVTGEEGWTDDVQLQRNLGSHRTELGDLLC